MSQNQYLKKKTKRYENENAKKEKKDEKDNQNNENKNKGGALKEKLKNNIIKGRIIIEKEKTQTTLINSYENVAKYLSNYFGINNEEEIKDCEMYINDEKIDFTYDYIFPKKGNYIIKYIFNKILNSTNYMFFNCNLLTILDLSNFNTQNVTNMSYMFSNCYSLKSLDL